MKKYLIPIIGLVVVAAVASYLYSVKDIVTGFAYNEADTIKTYSATSTADNIESFSVKGKQNITIAVMGKLASSTIKFAGSIQTTPANPVNTASSTNQWSYVDVVELDGSAALVGSTGVTLSGVSSSSVKMYKLTQTNLSYLTPVMTAFTTGTVKVMIMSDEGSNR